MEGVVLLLRGVNVGGHRKVPMVELRALVAELGGVDVRTYINSGNVVLTLGSSTVSQAALRDLQSRVEQGLEPRFGFSVPVVARSARQWRAYQHAAPFADAREERANLVMLGLSQRELAADALEVVRSKATRGERVALHHGALVIDFAAGSARSKITPAVLDKAAGSPLTTRNWRSVLKLDAMLSR